ncbi:MAG: CRISPR-associated endonuclease Cas2 [Parcubacteria group bacterium]|nr:CRISPR-associated endonuclease Cas2 [Parcubacteria group bacterium]
MTDNNSLTRSILEKLQEAGELTLDAVLPQSRVEARVWRTLLGLPAGYEFSPRTFSAVLSRLKKQGLVSKSGSHRKSLWSLARKGSDALVDVIDSELPPEDGIIRLVMFDIPEKERRKRDLVRLELAACGYSKLQRSVWLGYRPLPDKFMKSLDDLKLKGKLHIVSVDKGGTLEMV